MNPRIREREIQHEMGECVFFRGIHRDEPCSAGIDIRALVGGPDLGWAVRLPCFLSHSEKCEVVCDKRQFPTREEAEALVAEAEARVERTMKVMQSAHEDAKAKGFKRGNGGASEMPCPAECGGTLRYRVASLNGHMHAACTTESCVRWME